MSFLKEIVALSYDDFLSCCLDSSKLSILRTHFSLNKEQSALLLKAYALRYYPHELIEGRITEQDCQIIREASLIVDYTTPLEEDPLTTEQSSSLLELLTIFSGKFKEWLALDRARATIPFLKRYRQILLLQKQGDKEFPYYLPQLRVVCNVALMRSAEQIVALGGDQALRVVDQVDYSTLIPELELHALLRKESRDLFWREFTEQLPSYQPVIRLIGDYIHRYARLLNNRSDLVRDLAEKVDVELITQRLKLEGNPREVLMPYFAELRDRFVELMSEDEAPHFLEELEQALSEEDLYVVCYEFFTMIFREWDVLEQEVFRVRALLNLAQRGVEVE